MSNTMIDGRRADSARRRQRVIKAVNDMIRNGGEISVSAIARAAGVDRTLLYRHPDLLALVHTAQATPPATEGVGPQVSRASLQADLANANARLTRQTAHITQLERRLSEALGEQVWRESGLGTPTDVDQLQRRVTELEQQVVDLRDQLDERDQELDAARAANRQLIADLDRPHSSDPVSSSSSLGRGSRAAMINPTTPTTAPMTSAPTPITTSRDMSSPWFADPHYGDRLKPSAETDGERQDTEVDLGKQTQRGDTSTRPSNTRACRRPPTESPQKVRDAMITGTPVPAGAHRASLAN
jgi:transposase-like protein